VPDEWFHETLHPTMRQGLRIEKVLYRKKTEFQDLMIFETPVFGRVLALDGAIQTTEGDEFIYHEMLAHPAILAHGNMRHVLIIGGGDGGALREVLRHPVESVTLVDIDRAVIDLCREYLPAIAGGAFEDRRVRVVIDDGIRFVAESEADFDLIIVDSTDPVGPATGLFQPQFYRGCKRLIGADGILITQNGVPFIQPEEITSTYRSFQPLFRDAAFYLAPVPTYTGGFLAFGWGTQNPAHRARAHETIGARFKASGIETRYYNPDIHLAAFALPNYVKDLMKAATSS
jgi:spermidine synthase